MPWSFFKACEKLSEGLNYEPPKAITTKGRALTQGELACYSSHYSLWKAVIDQGLSGAFVFEDDVFIDWRRLEGVDEALRTYKQIKYLRLNATRPCKMRLLTEHVPVVRALVDYRGYPLGAIAYYVSNLGARVLTKHCKDVVRPIDDELDRSWAHGLPNLCVFPYVAFEVLGPSTIGGQRFGQFAVPASLKWKRTYSQLRERILRASQFITRKGLCSSVDLLR